MFWSAAAVRVKTANTGNLYITLPDAVMVAVLPK